MGSKSPHARMPAGVGEWLIPPVCKTGAERLRRFKSCPQHQQTRQTGAAGDNEKGPAHIAQLVERVLGKNEVFSSNLNVGSTQQQLSANGPVANSRQQ